MTNEGMNSFILKFLFTEGKVMTFALIGHGFEFVGSTSRYFDFIKVLI